MIYFKSLIDTSTVKEPIEHRTPPCGSGWLYAIEPTDVSMFLSRLYPFCFFLLHNFVFLLFSSTQETSLQWFRLLYANTTNLASASPTLFSTRVIDLIHEDVDRPPGPAHLPLDESNHCALVSKSPEGDVCA